jgi:hypothetical protein
VKTKRVRIVVAISADGSDWTATGWGCDGKPQASDNSMRASALDCVDADNVAVHFVEVDVPLPEAQTLSGEVVP